MKNTKSLLEEIRRHVGNCPLGYHDGKLITHRNTNDTEIIDWLIKLQRLTGAR